MGSSDVKPVAFDLATAQAILEFVKKNKPITDKTGKEYTVNAEGVFVCKVTQSGGSAGSCAGDCSFTYTVKDLAGNTIKTSAVPMLKRISQVAYNTPSANSYGLAYYDGANVPQLICALEEVPKTTTTTVVVSGSCSGGNVVLTTADLRVFACS